MTPIGPYWSDWSDKPMYIIGTVEGLRLAVDSQQPNEATLVPNMREAKAWLRDNGYILKESGNAHPDSDCAG